MVVTNKATPEEIKEKLEQQLRLQRAAHHQKRALEMQKQAGKLMQSVKAFSFNKNSFLIQASTSVEEENKESGTIYVKKMFKTIIKLMLEFNFR